MNGISLGEVKEDILKAVRTFEEEYLSFKLKAEVAKRKAKERSKILYGKADGIRAKVKLFVKLHWKKVSILAITHLIVFLIGGVL